MFIGTLYMQQVLGYSVLKTGAAWMAASLTSPGARVWNPDPVHLLRAAHD